MHLPPVEDAIWGLGTALKVLLCFLVIYRKLYRRYPLISLYLALLPVEVAAVWLAYRKWGYTSLPAWDAYWSALGVVLMARGLAIAELCWKALARFPGIWSVMKKLLLLAASVLLAWAGIAAARNAHWIVAFVLTTEQGLEFAASVILTLLFAISVSYRAWLGNFERNFTLGLALYSIFQSLNRTFLSPRLIPFLPWWDSTRIIIFDFAMVLWLIPLLKPQEVPAAAGPLLKEAVTSELLERLLADMRKATDELKRLGKAFRK